MEEQDAAAMKRVQDQWARLGEDDPLWSVLTDRGQRGGRWDEDEFLATGEQEIDALLERLGAFDARRVTGTAVDFGCGAGRLTQALAARVGAAMGVDVSPGMIRTAERLNRQGETCRFLLNESGDLSAIDDASVDLVYTCRVLQHMQPSLAHGYVREFFRIVRPGGFVVFQIPSRPGRSLKGLGLRVVPTGLATRLRRGMEMHGTPRAVVRELVDQAGGGLLAEDPDGSTGPGWESWLYIARGLPPTSKP
jgi:SAM-dependent methyltransferase